MPRRARAIGLALTSAALLAGSVLSAAPASAATAAAKPSGGSLTAAYCTSIGGGTSYTSAKGVKTCTVSSSYTVTGGGSNDAYFPYDSHPELYYTAYGYHASWTIDTTYTDTWTLTQKGGQAISQGPTSTVESLPWIHNYQCNEILGPPDANGNSSWTYADFNYCNSLGLYPA